MKASVIEIIEANKAVVWTNTQTKMVWVAKKGREFGPRLRDDWSDPIGASYADWLKMKVTDKAQLMIETAIDLAMAGYDLRMILREFAKVDCFYDLGRESFPMCRALTKALVGKRLEPNTMSFDELMACHELGD